LTLSSSPPTTPKPRFFSTVTGDEIQTLDAVHWERWLTSPVRFDRATASMRRAARRVANAPVLAVQVGTHPVLTAALSSLSPAAGTSPSPRDRGSFN
jgi:acyl transferase domain-containing protein